MDICGYGFHRVDQPAVFIHADVRLIAKVLGVTLFDLMGIRITLFLFVLGKRGSGNNC